MGPQTHTNPNTTPGSSFHSAGYFDDYVEATRILRMRLTISHYLHRPDAPEGALPVIFFTGIMVDATGEQVVHHQGGSELSGNCERMDDGGVRCVCILQPCFARVKRMRWTVPGDLTRPSSCGPTDGDSSVHLTFSFRLRAPIFSMPHHRVTELEPDACHTYPTDLPSLLYPTLVLRSRPAVWSSLETWPLWLLDRRRPR